MRSLVRCALTLSMALPSIALASPVQINEFYRDSNLGTGNEWIEVVLTEDLTAAQLEGYFVGDSSSSTAAKLSVYKFTSMSSIASVFPAGTVIVVSGTAGPAVDTSFNPAGGDWNLVLATGSTNVQTVTSGGDLASTDVVWVDTDGTTTGTTFAGGGFAVNWDSTPGTLGALANVTIGVPNNASGVVLNADPANAATVGNWSVSVASGSLTPGLSNGGANTTAIDALRAGGGCTDTDLDTVCDTEDVCPGGDDRIDADVDGEPDFCDACPLDAPNDDDDADGVCDSDDVCPGGDDGVDTDTDGEPDACDTCPLDAPNEDDDADTVCDSDDVCVGGDDRIDTDSDGTPDFCDDCPLDAPVSDDDGDGVCDSDDLCPTGDDGADADSDGVPDACDDCDTGGGIDTDGDGAEDDCDLCPLDNPNDTDGDTVCDSADACPGGDDRIDTDTDGIADDCDACPVDGDPGDADGDGFCDSLDVCASGDDSMDGDGDGVPDACDECPGVPDLGDTDGDGIPDGCDNCDAAVNVSQLDTDNDGIGNACDVPTLAAGGAPRAGRPLTFTITGLEPGEAAAFVGAPGTGGSGPCNPAWSLCLDLGAGYTVLGTALANGSGVAVKTVTVPNSAGSTYSVQGLALRDADSEKSNRLTGTVAP